MESSVLAFLIKLIHLLATVAWIGGMFTNFFIYMPSIKKVLDPPTTGKLMGVVMNRFRIMVYISLGLFLLTGMFSSYVHFSSPDLSADTSWNVLLAVKMGIFALMGILALYAFEFLAPKVAKIAAKGPSTELVRIQKTQMIFALLGFILGLSVLALSAAL